MYRGISSLVALLLVATACSGRSSQQEVLVFGASSLSDVLRDAEIAFEAANPGVDVQLNLAGSSSLREQLIGGAPADLFAPASLTVMDQAIEAGEIAGPVTIVATNGLSIVVPSGNPANVTDLSSFGDRDLLLGLCNPAVPCGAFAREALAEAGVDPQLDTEEPDVRSLLNKVANGELDAGIVYQTDVLSAGDAVEGIALPARTNRSLSYGVAITDRSDSPELAAAFVTFLTSEPGRELFTARGFAAS